MKLQFPLITVLGPTAVGKTAFAANLASRLNGEIISADSRQVFKGMDIGTGKDLADYNVGGHTIPAHLIDLAEPGSEYNVYRFLNDFESAKSLVISRGRIPLLCGGTGLYLEAVLLDYNLYEVPVNEKLREELSSYKDEELVFMLSGLRPLHNTTDVLDRDRIIRAIEIGRHKQDNSNYRPKPSLSNTPVFGIRFDRKTNRIRITERLTQRLNQGMIEEVRKLLNKGISNDRMKMYGLEYKYVTMYLSGELSYEQMFTLLNTAIHQFSKRQMTWFRRMENKGIKICWLDGEDGLEDNLKNALIYLDSFASHIEKE
jgi:tRNA dimethylallyltransferase